MDRIVYYPAPILRADVPECMLNSSEIKKIVQRLKRVMAQEKHGIGIAAPQIGIPQRIAIVDVSSRDPSAKLMVLVNPKIIDARDEMIGKEGCMSVPDYTAIVRRYQWIHFSFKDENGNQCEKMSSGIEAICVQHEIDHLNGKLLIDRVQCLKQDLLPRRLSAKR